MEGVCSEDIMRLFFIRHGQSGNNALWTRTQSNVDRVSDPQLTEIGKKQAEAAAQFLDKCLKTNSSNEYGVGETHIYCSLMDRAIQSGLIIANKLSLPLNAHLDIHENGGLYLENPATAERTGEPGRTLEDLKTSYPGLILPEGTNPLGWWNRPFEERETRRIRAKKVLNDLVNRFGTTNATVLFVSHGGFYNYLLRSFLELREDTEVWFELYNAAITLFEISDDFKNLLYSNRFDFIPESIIT
jgi:2,3-bisphosphoglycerate-dependent phosphoglycerate mutase